MLIIVSQIIPIMITYSNVKYSNELLLVYVFSKIYLPRIVKKHGFLEFDLLQFRLLDLYTSIIFTSDLKHSE
jgi:hypothetical protein